MARYIGPVCRLCRREGMKLFLKGERCYTEKCAIEKRNFAAGAAREIAEAEAGRLRRAAPREAEGQAHLRRARGSVPPLLRSGGADARDHGRDAPPAARAAAGQCRVSPWFRNLAPAGAAARAARPLHRERPQGRHPVVLAQAGRRRGRATEQPQEHLDRARTRRGEGARRAGVARLRRGRHVGASRLDPDPRTDQSARAGAADRRAL